MRQDMHIFTNNKELPPEYKASASKFSDFSASQTYFTSADVTIGYDKYRRLLWDNMRAEVTCIEERLPDYEGFSTLSWAQVTHLRSWVEVCVKRLTMQTFLSNFGMLERFYYFTLLTSYRHSGVIVEPNTSEDFVRVGSASSSNKSQPG